MKLSFFLLTCFTFSMLATSVESQNAKVTLNKKNVALEVILEEIENQTDYLFTYNKSRVDVQIRKSVNVKDKELDLVLEDLLKETDINYSVEGTHIILIKTDRPTPVVTGLPTPQQSLRTIRGIVLESTGEPAIGANVSVKGTTKGTITDVNGEFSLEVSDNDLLEISYIGFLKQEIRVAGNSVINVTLQEDTQLLDEVVVVGYGIQKKVNLTGAVATVDSKSLEARPITNVSTALAGLASGVTVRQGSARPGDDSATIRVRGVGTLNNSDPLVIVDGIEGVLDAVNPNDIESMTILKDAASSAIYGARAANGVVLITTKKGNRGKPRIDFSATLSLAQPVMIPKFENNYARYMELFNEGRTNLGQSPTYEQGLIDTWRAAEQTPNAVNEYGVPYYVLYPNTDWADAVYENNWVQNYNLSIAGGGDNSRYMLSAGYLNNPGLINNTGSERYQFRMNMESTVLKIITLGTNTFMSFQDNDVASTDDAAFNYLRQNHPGTYAYMYDGYWPTPVGNQKDDPSYLRRFTTTDGKDHVSRINTTWFARIDLWKGLSFETKFNYQMRLRERNTYPVTSETKNFATNNVVTIATSPEEMTSSFRRDKNYQLTFDNVLRYSFDIQKDHSFALLLGHNEYYYNAYETSFSKKGFTDEGMYVLDSVGETENKVSGKENDRAMRSFFGRLNYDYKSKYLFEFNLRHDGSSRFGQEKRWGNFPSVSAAWRISEESFMDAYRDFMPNLKLRVSWGKLGNDAAGNYDYQANYATEGYYAFGNEAVQGLRQKKMGNTLLHWESTEVKDVGVEGNIFGGRMAFEIGYYDKFTSGILTTPPIYNVLGTVNGPTSNTSDARNRGMELSLGWNDQIGRVRYGVRGNFSYNKSKVEKYKGAYVVNQEDGTNNYGEVSGTFLTDGSVVEGYMMGEYYMRSIHNGDGSYFHSDGSVSVTGGPRDGIIRTEEDMCWVLAMKEAGYSFSPVNSVSQSQLWYGDVVYANNNGDKTFGDSNDRIFTGKSRTPKYNYGFSADAAWNNFDFSMVWAGSGAMYYHMMITGYNNTLVSDDNAISKWVADDHYYYNHENPSDPNNNINGKYPRLTYNASTTNTQTSTRTLYNASYLKLKNLQIGYTIPPHLTKKIGVERVRIYASGENLLTITPFKFFDPEIGNSVGYLTMRQFAFGLNVNF